MRRLALQVIVPSPVLKQLRNAIPDVHLAAIVQIAQMAHAQL
jgi:hypothetical protein